MVEGEWNEPKTALGGLMETKEEGTETNKESNFMMVQLIYEFLSKNCFKLHFTEYGCKFQKLIGICVCELQLFFYDLSYSIKNVGLEVYTGVGNAGRKKTTLDSPEHANRYCIEDYMREVAFKNMQYLYELVLEEAKNKFVNDVETYFTTESQN